MTSLAVEMQLTGLDRAAQAIERVTGFDRFELMDVIGRLVQLQTRRRLKSEKIGPNGELWPHNRKGSAPLYASGALHDSIDYQTGLGQVTIGSPLIYAAIHHFGGVIKAKIGKALAFMAGNKKVFAKSVTMPARPYLGISPANAREIEDVVEDFMREVLK
ncbi:phage virion morphogenesis protein [Cognatishimia sp. MH4019]|uniref:phage virion morphogenesis protein n=1 Tax=Cognatishimia sp. MH4019 TaxID=2854030 RepID=UPI001CD237F5|nr:phage virion morphogenesis protein [Cognatishimia sp. MH4019]